MKNDYPTVLTIVIGFPFTILGIIVFAIVGDGNGQFDKTEVSVFATMIIVLVLLGIFDLVRWGNRK